MSKQDVYDFLGSKGIPYEVTEHVPVYTIEDMRNIGLPYPEDVAKNLFVRDDKKRNYYLITVLEERAINLNEFQARYQTRKLSFASENDLMAILGLQKGAVTPFGLLNDSSHSVHLYISKEFENRRIGIHPNENTATVWIMGADVIRIARELGNPVTVF